MGVYGLRPVPEIQFADYILPAYDQIASEVARLRYRSAGQFSAPLTIRTPVGGGIFGGGGNLIPRSAPANSGLMLLAKTQDEWGINPGTQVKSMTISVEALTGAQLKNLLKALPDGMTYGLNLSTEED